MLDSYVLLQVRNLRNLIDYLIEIKFDDSHTITLSELDMLDSYLFRLEKAIT